MGAIHDPSDAISSSTVTTMPEAMDHPAFTAPDDRGARIWRYMDFTKFLAMLEQRGLFFTRADRLGDPFEGSIPAANYTKFKEVHRRDLDNCVGTDEEKFPGFEQSIRKLYQGIRNDGPRVLMNCWHMNPYESAAMWKLYSDTDKSICIQSTYEKLRVCLPESVYTGIIRYIDYDRETISLDNIIRFFMHKRISFVHESEVRAVILNLSQKDKEPPEFGQWHPVDLAGLIDAIVVSPSSPAWFVELVAKVTERYGYKFAVTPSSLTKSPLW
jgi:hypothetical protein